MFSAYSALRGIVPAISFGLVFIPQPAGLLHRIAVYVGGPPITCARQARPTFSSLKLYQTSSLDLFPVAHRNLHPPPSAGGI